MTNIKLVIGYDGTDYRGFQRQIQTDQTIQNILENALGQIFEKRISIIGAGRTDSGVHATGQVVNFHCESRIPVGRLQSIINSHLPRGIQVNQLEAVPADFHARKHALSRQYQYVLYSGLQDFPGIDRYACRIPEGIDCQEANAAAQQLLGTLDCRAFMTSGSSTRCTIKTVTVCQFEQTEHLLTLVRTGTKMYRFTIEADSFLYNMVRIIVANVCAVGLGQKDIQSFRELINSRNRKLAGKMFPARGLFLTRVKYELN